MVYIPEGSFFAGDRTSNYTFKQGSSDTDPWYIGSEDAITTANAAGSGTGVAETAAEYYHNNGGDALGSVYTIPAAFPKGYQAFYMMKGEISQEQWVTFFNTLTATQKTTRDITSSTNSGKNTDNLDIRNNVSWTSGDATLPDRGGGKKYAAVAMNYISWADLTALLDWSALRPMSELEFERAGRGPYPSLSGEYAWGSTSFTQATNLISNAGLDTERAPAGSNCNSNDQIAGPLRVGSFAYGVSTRVAAGAGYYGAMDLSGNLSEAAVTVGNSTGRSFEGRYHGNGALDSNGNHNVSTWPANTGAGTRGGHWQNTGNAAIRLSYRQSAASGAASRNDDYGGRGVRVAP
jgi:formylglycine-generating enzyme required for sulfatase activity